MFIEWSTAKHDTPFGRYRTGSDSDRTQVWLASTQEECGRYRPRFCIFPTAPVNYLASASINIAPLTGGRAFDFSHHTNKGDAA